MSDTLAVPALPAHVQWLATHRGPALVACLQGGGVVVSADDALAQMALCDPSPGLHAVQWLCDTLLGGGYRWEDLAGGPDSKVAETLRWFSQHRAGLAQGLRNLEDHASLASVYQAIQPMLETQGEVEDATPTGRALRRALRAQARAESTIVHEGAELRVVVPHTRFAAQWWGRGTRWCTSAESNNYFDHYNSDAPLIIAVLPHTRYQMWLGGTGLQFMDSADSEVSIEQVAKDWQWLQPLVEWACARAPGLLYLVPPQHRTHELCLAAMGRDGAQLMHVPHNQRTHAVCMRAVSTSSRAMFYVPPELLDQQICMAAMAHSPHIFSQVPACLRTYEMCLAAVAAEPRAFQWVPAKHRTQDMALAALRANGLAFLHLPEELKTLEVCRAAIATQPHILGMALGRVPLHLRAGLREEVVRVGGKGLGVIPLNWMTPGLLRLAVENSPLALSLVPDNLRTRELCLHAVSHQGANLCAVPPKFIDQEMCDLAVASDCWALMSVPKDFRTPQLCLSAVQGYHPSRGGLGFGCNLLEFVPASCLSPTICLLAAAQPHYPLHWMTEEYKTPEVCLLAMRSHPTPLHHVPRVLRTAEICALALQHYPDTLRHYIPADLQDRFPEPVVVAGPSWTAAAHLEGLYEHIAACAAAGPATPDRHTPLCNPAPG